MRIGHIINPVMVDPASDLFDAQPVTFDSMLLAKDNCPSDCQVDQFVIGFEEDQHVAPRQFVALPSLSRSVMDLGNFSKSRKLPLIRDILNALNDNNEIDYLIYTNVDIGLMPFFYSYVCRKIADGCDAMVINRRVIDREVMALDLLFAQVGVPHPGYDCFVFRKEILSQFILGNICIGANYIGRALIANIIAHSKNHQVIEDAHVTFHLGDDGAWLLKDYSEFDRHNRTEAYFIVKKLISDCDDEQRLERLNSIKEFIEERIALDQKKEVKEPQPATDDKWSIRKKIRFKLNQLLS